MKPNLLYLFVSLCVSLCGAAQSKTKADPLKTISNSDTVVFISHSSGCFHGYTIAYTLEKEKNGGRKVSYTKDSVMVVKHIEAKKYKAFLANFKTSYDKFAVKQSKSCTTHTTFELKNSGSSVKFTNSTCEAAFDPERFLHGLLK